MGGRLGTHGLTYATGKQMPAGSGLSGPGRALVPESRHGSVLSEDRLVSTPSPGTWPRTRVQATLRALVAAPCAVEGRPLSIKSCPDLRKAELFLKTESPAKDIQN